MIVVAINMAARGAGISAAVIAASRSEDAHRPDAVTITAISASGMLAIYTVGCSSPKGRSPRQGV